MRNKVVFAVAGVGLLMAPLVVMAAGLQPAGLQPTSAEDGAVVRELTRMEQQGALLQQQLKNVQLQQEIVSAQKAAHTGKAKPVLLGSSSVSGPSVLLLTGSAGHYMATIRLPNGQISPAMAGNILPGGYRITKISGDGVWTIHDGRTEALPFAVTNGVTSGMGSGEDCDAGQPAANVPGTATLPGMSGLSTSGINPLQRGTPMPGVNAPSGMLQPAGQP